MKKMFTLMAVLAMVFCMAACGNTAANDHAPSSEPSVVTEGKPETFFNISYNFYAISCNFETS